MRDQCSGGKGGGGIRRESKTSRERFHVWCNFFDSCVKERERERQSCGESGKGRDKEERGVFIGVYLYVRCVACVI